MDILFTQLDGFLRDHPIIFVLVTGILGSGLGFFTTYNKIFKEEIEQRYPAPDSNSQISLSNSYSPPSPLDLRVLWAIKGSFFCFFGCTILCTIIVLFIILFLFWLLERCFEYLKIIVFFLVSYAIASKTQIIQRINDLLGGFDLYSLSLVRNFVEIVLSAYEQFSSNRENLRIECREFLISKNTEKATIKNKENKIISIRYPGDEGILAMRREITNKLRLYEESAERRQYQQQLNEISNSPNDEDKRVYLICLFQKVCPDICKKIQEKYERISRKYSGDKGIQAMRRKIANRLLRCPESAEKRQYQQKINEISNFPNDEDKRVYLIYLFQEVCPDICEQILK